MAERVIMITFTLSFDIFMRKKIIVPTQEQLENDDLNAIIIIHDLHISLSLSL